MCQLYPTIISTTLLCRVILSSLFSVLREEASRRAPLIRFVAVESSPSSSFFFASRLAGLVCVRWPRENRPREEGDDERWQAFAPTKDT